MAQKTSTLDWLSIGEAAKYLGVSRDTLRRWEKRGKLKSYRTPSNRRRYTIYDLELAMKSPKPAPFIAPKPKPKPPEPTPPSPEQSQIPADTREGRISEIVEGPKAEPVIRPEPRLTRPEPTMKPTPPLTEQAPAVPQPVPSKQPSRFRTLAISFALILTLLVILPLAINTLLTLLRGPGEILSPIPGVLRGF